MMQRTGLDALLDDCQRRLTLFAPTNAAMTTFFNTFTPTFFQDPNNFPLNPIGNLIRSELPTLRMDSFEDEFLTAVFFYQIAPGLHTRADLNCFDEPLVMYSRGSSFTVCDTLTGESGSVIGQAGTCNKPGENGGTPRFDTSDVAAGNGIIHVVSNVLIPSPDGTIRGCKKIEGASTLSSRLIAEPEPIAVAEPSH